MTKDNEKIKNARVGYQAAIAMQTAEVQQTGNRNNAMILAQSIFIYAIFTIISNNGSFLYYGPLTFIGLLMCIIWFLTIRRAFMYEKYWVLSALELEEHFLSDTVSTISRGGKFSDGKEVMLKIDDKDYPMRMSFNIKTKQLSYILALFALNVGSHPGTAPMASINHDFGLHAFSLCLS